MIKLIEQSIVLQSVPTTPQGWSSTDQHQWTKLYPRLQPGFIYAEDTDEVYYFSGTVVTYICELVEMEMDYLQMYDSTEAR